MKPYEVQFRGPARKALSETLPESVAYAVYEFCMGPLAENPQRVGSPLQPPLNAYRSARRGTYRIIYRINETDRSVVVERIGHRGEVSRRP